MLPETLPRTEADTVPRFVALDVFRGLSMAAMVVVNNPGDWGAMYWPLEHAEWNGWTPTDLIFPFFLFIVGVSLTVSRQTTDAPVWRILKRAFALVAFGLLLTGFPRFDVNRWRFTGILPRIAFCYLWAALLYRWTAGRWPKDAAARAGVIVVVTLAMLIAYWAILTRVAAPGGEPGDLTPEGNIGAWLDRTIFGTHLYRRARWDPEGLLSSVPGVATTLLGVLTGMWLRTGATVRRKAARLALGGAILFIAGEAWHPWFPINKQLWTSSYVLMTGGAAALGLAACIFAIDVRGWRRWSGPFVVLGSNAIALFVASGLLGKALVIYGRTGADGRLVVWQSIVYDALFGWIQPPKIASLCYSLVFLLLMYGPCDWLYRRRIFLKA